MPKLSEYVKVAEAAEILGVSYETVRTLGYRQKNSNAPESERWPLMYSKQ